MSPKKAANTTVVFAIQHIEKKRAYEEIVEVLWQAIEKHSLKPGDRLPPEIELSRQLKVARPTLREALSVLHYLGIIESVQGGGYYVKSLTPPDLAGGLATLGRTVSPFEVATARLTIEPDVARLAARERGEKDLEHMRQILDRVPKNVSKGEYPLELDGAFHSALAQATGNALLAQVVETLFALRNQVFFKAVQSAGFGTERYLEDTHADHERVLAAVAEQKPDEAYQAMRNHLLKVRAKTFGLAED